MMKVKELVKGNIKIIEERFWVDSYQQYFSTYTYKKLTKNGIWRKYKKCNKWGDIEEAMIMEECY